MIKYFSKAFKITNENIMLTTPLLLFIILFIFYLGLIKYIPANPIAFVVVTLTTLFMLSAFAAGWLYLIKRAIELDKQAVESEEEKAKLSLGLLKDIPAGVGEYFLPFVGVSIFYGVLILVFMLLTYKIGLLAIGKVDIPPAALKAALNSQTQMRAFIASLSVDQLVKLNAWNFLIMIMMTLYSFLTMFWASEVVYKTKNAFLAFFKSLSFLFKGFFSSIILFGYITVINFVVSLLGSFAAFNPILHFITTLIYFYFVVYVVVLIFLYYDSESQKRIEVKVESKEPEQKQEEDNSGNGSDSIG